MSKLGYKTMRRTIVIIITFALCFPSSAFTITDDTIPGKLSPSMSFQLEEFADSYTVAAICKTIEKYASFNNEKAIENICSWSQIAPHYSNVLVTLGKYEVTIDIPSEGLTIRYFFPGKAIMLGKNWTKICQK
jgi:hypothetical protein